ncbi:17579_t:CDS:1, partial [Cetraspora pellucida]
MRKTLRLVDLKTFLYTQLTYKELISNVFDIKALYIEVDSLIVEPAQATTVTSTTT